MKKMDQILSYTNTSTRIVSTVHDEEMELAYALKMFLPIFIPSSREERSALSATLYSRPLLPDRLFTYQTNNPAVISAKNLFPTFISWQYVLFIS